MSRGSRKFPSIAHISQRLEYLYAAEISTIFYKRGQSIVAGFFADFIKDDFVPQEKSLLADVCEVLFDLVFNPLVEDGKFNEQYTQGEKKDLINIINSKLDNKAVYAKEACVSAMYEGNPYGLCIHGKVEDVDKATPEQIYDRYCTITRECPIEICFNGKCDSFELEELIKKSVPLNEYRISTFPKTSILSGEPEKIKEQEEKMPVAQGKLVMGFRIGGVTVNSSDSFAFTLFNEILGGSASSKLFLNVREALSLCYYCKSMPDQFMSNMFISSGIENKNKDLAQREILKQLEAMKSGDFTQEHIEQAKLSIKNSYKALDDSAHSIMRWYVSRIIAGNSDTPEQVCDGIMRVTKQEIIDVAKKVCLDTVFFLRATENQETQGEE